ncbi:MAG: sigma 54-interacting transcriptional regulator [candidate division Zixibacteria bacterium]|nr:sigma 54-interacting transcriptional regulator [candidate division Zixibacteria bacterium]
MQTTTTYDKTLLDDLFANRQYAEALQYIDSLNVRRSRDLSREDIAHLYFAQGQCLYWLGDYRKAAVKVRCSIWLSDSLNDNFFYARQKYTLGQIYRETGRLEEALAAYTESHAFFKRVRDYDRTLVASTVIALIHFQKGDYQRAIEVNEDVMQKARLYRLPQRSRTAAFNLCRVLMLTGDLSQVGELLDSIADDCTDLLSLTWLESLRGMLSVRLLDDAGAIEHLGNAIARARECHYRRDEVVCLEYLALNDFYHGRHAEAIGYCEQILATPEVTPSAVAQTLWLLTEVYVAENKLTLAAETGAKAEQAITQVKEWAELGCLHRALALLADKRGDLQGTIDHFDKASEILNRHGARYELAVTYLAAGAAACLDAETKKERLHQAKTLFTEMDVPKWVTQTEEAIAYLSLSKPQCKSIRSTKNSIEQPEIITQNPDMARILEDATKLAATDMTILITGETGTGKDLLAKYIHCHSKRVSGPFHNQNMATLPAALIEAELFGYRRGAFTGADGEKAGLLESVNGGTFCFNEIGEMSLSMQTKLLDVLESGMVRRLNDNVGRPIDVRFIAVTNRDLEERVNAGKFRCDLLYRLRGAHLHLPPLGDRQDDLPLLTQFFLQRLGFGEYKLREAEMIVEQCGCYRYDWPGNVRELGSVLRKAVALTPSRILPELIGRLSIEVTRLSKTDGDDDERAKLAAVLERNGGNLTRAAEAVGMPASTFRRRLRK